jgi:hypothetical protein
LVGIAAVMVFGLVVLLTALTYDASVKTDRPNDPAFARRRRHRREPVRMQRRLDSPTALGTARAVALNLRALLQEWWPLVRHHARRLRWLSLESTTGQVIASIVASVIIAYLLVAIA